MQAFTATPHSRLDPPFRLPEVRREWYPTAMAARLLGMSDRTLRRRLGSPKWIEGQHYRWVVCNTRRVLEVNVGAAIRLMDQSSWH